MKYIKIHSVYLIAASMILSSISGLSFADNVYKDDADNIKVTHTQQVLNIDKTAVMNDYVAVLRRKIKNNWYPPASSFENSATLMLTIDKEGKLINAKIVKSSENEGFDNSLIEASQKVKYPPLPEIVNQDCVDVLMDFNMQRRHITKPSAQNK